MKNKINFMFLISFFFFSVIFCFAQTNGNIKIDVLRLKSNKGKVKVLLYANSTDYKKEKVYKELYLTITSSSAIGEFKDIPIGNYGIMVYHDENSNGKMDTNFIGMPKEGIGYSNDAAGKMGPPEFDLVKFGLSKNGIQCIIHIIYL